LSAFHHCPICSLSKIDIEIRRPRMAIRSSFESRMCQMSFLPLVAVNPLQNASEPHQRVIPILQNASHALPFASNPFSSCIFIFLFIICN
jgi:hypothetical protein